MDINESAVYTLVGIIAFAVGILAGWLFRDKLINSKA